MRSLFGTERARWWTLAVLWVLLLGVGISGFVQQGSADGVDRPFLDSVYLTLQLATLDYDGSSGPMNWQLQVARFVVPLLAAGTVLQTASLVFRRELARLRAGRLVGHTIVCGLGDTGARLALAFAEAGERVVAVEPSAAVAAASGVAEVVEHTFEGSAADVEVLRAAGIGRAARLVVVSGDDASNIEVARAAWGAVADRRGSPLRCSVELNDADLAVLLRSVDLDASGGLRLGYFSLHERAARALLSDLGPDLSDETAPHLMLFGLGQFGRSLLLAVSQQWADLHPGTKLGPTVVDRRARGRWEALRLQHPALGDVCEPTLVDLDLDEPQPEDVDAFRALLDEDPPRWVAVAFDDEPRALAHAMFLHQHLPRGEVPIVVRMRSDDGLGGLLDPDARTDGPFPGIVRFAFLDRTCTVATVDGGVREQLAEAVHEDYLAQRGEAEPPSSLARGWAELSDDQREDSRHRVDAVIAQLDAIGCDLVPLRRWGLPEVELTEGEIERLAEAEHERWRSQRVAEGWTFGPGKDEERKVNRLLVPWTELDEPDRAWNLGSARALLPMLARNGFEPIRRAAVDR